MTYLVRALPKEFLKLNWHRQKSGAKNTEILRLNFNSWFQLKSHTYSNEPAV